MPISNAYSDEVLASFLEQEGFSKNAYLPPDLMLTKVMRRRRKSLFDEMFEGFEELFENVESLEGGTSMYSISVTYDEYGRPVVRVSAQGDVNKEELEKYLRKMYLNAKIVWEGGPEGRSTTRGHIKEIVIDEVEGSRQRGPRSVKIREVDVERPKIVEVKVEGEEEGERKW